MGRLSAKSKGRLKLAAGVFAAFVALAFAIIAAASFVPAITDFALPLVGVLFLAGGLVAAGLAGFGGGAALKVLWDCAVGMSPGMVLILMAVSVKYIIANGGIMDTILHAADSAISGAPPFVAALLVYGFILLLELFIGSSSAKAFLIMPLVAPLADLVGLTRQTAVLAFSFGDGFSNVLYPTNPVLLICLGLTVVTYTKWFKWTIKLQLAATALACAFLALAVAAGYGPF